MDTKQIIQSLGFLPNNIPSKEAEWSKFYEVCLKLETKLPQYFNPSSIFYCTPHELINALCFSCPYMYEARYTHLHWTEWEIRRVKCYGFID